MFIPIKAVGKERPRYSAYTKSFYTPKKTKDFESTIGAYVKLYMRQNGIPIQEGPVSVEIEVINKIPDSWSIKKRNEALLGSIRPVGTPDSDNVLKAVLDGMNGIAFHDDKQVTQIYFNRLYGEKDCIKIDIKDPS